MKCIIIDMDGTLLNDELRITDEDYKAIKVSLALGNKVVIATGRAYFDAKHILDEYNLKCPIIASNGAEIGEGENYELVDEIPVPLAQFLIEYLNANQYYFQVYLEGNILTSKKYEDFLLNDLMQTDIEENFFRNSIKAQTKQYGLSTSNTFIDPNILERIVKLIVVSPNHEKLDKLQCMIKTLTPIMGTSSNPFNLEIGSSTISKEKTIKKFIEKRNISQEDCYVIGDNHNDLGLFNSFNNSIAMQNAIPQIKELASFQTFSNNNGGVSHAIKNYIL